MLRAADTFYVLCRMRLLSRLLCGQTVLFLKAVEFLDKGGGLVSLQFRQIIVDLKSAVLNLNDTDAHIGAVIGNPFAVCQKVREDQAQFNAAFALLQPGDVTVPYVHSEVVNDLLQRFYPTGKLLIVLEKASTVIFRISLRAAKSVVSSA